MTSSPSEGPRRNAPWMRLAIGFWTVLVVVVLVKTALKPHSHTVYTTYAQAGRVWGSLDPTSNDPNADYLNRQYAPFFAVLIHPFCSLEDRWGGVLWSAAMLAVFLGGFARLMAIVGEDWTDRQRGLAWLLLPWCGITSLYNGQVNVLISGALLWATALAIEGRWRWAGVALALPVCIKTYPIAMAMVLSALFPRRALVPTLAAIAVGSLSPLLFWPAETVAHRYADFAAFLASHEHYNYNFVRLDWHDFLCRWLVEVPRTQYLLVQMATGALVLSATAATLGAGGGRRDAILRAYVLSAFWMVLFGPATEEATYLLLSPAGAMLIADSLASSRAAFAVLFVLGAFLGPLQTSILGETVRKGVFSLKLAPAALAAFFAWQVVEGFRGVFANVRVERGVEVVPPTALAAPASESRFPRFPAFDTSGAV